MKYLIMAVAFAGLTACTSTQQGAAIGTAGGAIAGQLIGGDTKSTLIGAAAGAAVGGLTGQLVGRAPATTTQPTLNSGAKQCVYQRNDGSQYQDACPAGY